MAERPLNPEEAALWRRVVETVRPAAGRVMPPIPPASVKPAKVSPVTAPVAVAPKMPARPAPQTLDGTWDRLLAKGGVAPDRTVDLHGDTLDSAYGRIDAALAAAEQTGERVLLLVTGKPGGTRTAPPGSNRGAIRAVVVDWLAASRHASRIAAVRPAHPRHGGAGALYVVLRRKQHPR